MPDDKVKSAARVFEILEFFAVLQEPARMSKVAHALGHPTASVAALLKTMVSLGYMHLDETTRCYIPAARLKQLTEWVESQSFEHTVVLDAMHKLRNEVCEPIVLATPKDIYLEYIESLHHYEGTNTHIKSGTRRLLLQNGIGWLLLSRMPFNGAMEAYNRTLEIGELTALEFPEDTFKKIIDTHRATDISFLKAKDLLRPTAHWNAVMISTLLPTPPGQRPLGIGVHGPIERLVEKADLINQKLHDMTEKMKHEM